MRKPPSQPAPRPPLPGRPASSPRPPALGTPVLSGHLGFHPCLTAPRQIPSGPPGTGLRRLLLPSSLLRLLVSALGDVMPRIPLMEYEEPAESVLTDDTCVTEPVDTVRRERGWSGPGGRAVGAGALPGRRPKPEHSRYAGPDATACGGAGATDAVSGRPGHRPRAALHLGDGGSPRAIGAGFSAAGGGGCGSGARAARGLSVQKGTQDSVRRALAQTPACPRMQEAGEWSRGGRGWGPTTSQPRPLTRQVHSLLTSLPIHTDINTCTLIHSAAQTPNGKLFLLFTLPHRLFSF